MRTRDKSLSDYGVPPENAKKLYTLCADSRYQERLAEAVCAVIPPGSREAVFTALSERLGYKSVLDSGMNAYCAKNGFYSYKRQAAAEFYKGLVESGEWED